MLVSVLIPCWNAEAWIEGAVASALAQTWSDLEVLVVDDGSQDRSPTLLQAWSDRITLHCRENRGGNPTRNELLALARGEWVQFLDADDELTPEKIARQMATAAAEPEADVVYSPLVIEHHRRGRVEREVWAPHRGDGSHDPWEYHLAWKLTQTGGALFRRSTLEAIGGWRDEQACCQDNELFFRLLQAGARFVHCDHAGAVYRRFEDGSVSTARQDRVRREMLRLLDAGEQWLAEHGQLSDRRRAAANGCRFGLARQLWPGDRELAAQAMAAIRRSDPSFQPPPGPHAPWLYRELYRWLGFSWAERIAAARRAVLGQPA